LDKPITLTELAEREELNPEYLSRLFMKETGKKIGEFIAEAKIKSAQYMLCHTDYSILDVALSLGYASQSSFTKAFTSYSGVSPKKYRDRNTTKVL
ncbi:MAG: helix-turn-helix transcriptional regulator, partial [Clostridiales bacterium]|nr:helix-turn-helix transcriptional regulator [Clostridiales bacterium]